MGRNNKGKHAEDSKKSGGFFKFLIICVILIVVILGILYGWYQICLSPIGTSSEKATFTVEMGSGPNKIAKILKENGLIRSELVFKVYVKLNEVTDFQAGTYTITKDMSLEQIINSLKSGKVFKDTGYNITFIEGKTFDYIAKTIAKNTNNTEQDVYDLVKDEDYLNSLIQEYWFITEDVKNKDIYYPLEGYLFPDTYTFEEKDISVKDIFKKMLDQMAKVLEPYKSAMASNSYNIHQILSIASIIEKEAIHDEDRKNISSVLYNRLRSRNVSWK